PNSAPDKFANMLTIDDGNAVDLSDYPRRYNTRDSLRVIGVGLLNYESSFQRFPNHAIYDSEGTTPLLSWRVAILPFIGKGNLYDQFHLDEPWDSPHNLSLLPLMPDVYSDPAVPNGWTTMLATTGEGTVFELRNRGQSLQQINDGAHNTTVVIHLPSDRAVEWTKPQDWVFDPNDPSAGLIGEGLRAPRQANFHAAFADGTVKLIPRNVDGDNFAAMVQRNDGNLIDFDNVIADNSPETSLRWLGLTATNFAFAYGHFPRHATYSTDGTQPLLSWRVQLLPFMDEQVLYDRFNHDEPWDSPHNLALLDEMPEVFKSAGVPDGMTTFQAITGDNTIFPISSTFDLDFNNITDPLRQTLLFVQSNDSHAVEWTRPMDLEFDPNDPRFGVRDATASGFFGVNAYGQTMFINRSISDDSVAALVERNDGTFVAGLDFDVPNHIELYRDTSIRLGEIAYAALNFESAFQRLPSHAIYSPPTSEGTPVLSWRVRLLPLLGYNDLYEQFNLDETWDSPHNLSLLPFMPDVYANPNVAGPMTLTQVVTSPVGKQITPFPISYEGVSLGSIADGFGYTIGFVEANLEHAVEWTKPQDLFYDPADLSSDPFAGFGEAFFKQGTHFVTIDGTVGFVEDCVPSSTIHHWLIAADGQVTPDLDCPTGTVPPIIRGPILPGSGRAVGRSDMDGLNSVVVPSIHGWPQKKPFFEQRGNKPFNEVGKEPNLGILEHYLVSKQSLADQVDFEIIGVQDEWSILDEALETMQSDSSFLEIERSHWFDSLIRDAEFDRR
ncbi:MAG: DUF1559 domain-containing protein, partial [Planctomycetota bacterium]